MIVLYSFSSGGGWWKSLGGEREGEGLHIKRREHKYIQSSAYFNLQKRFSNAWFSTRESHEQARKWVCKASYLHASATPVYSSSMVYLAKQPDKCAATEIYTVLLMIKLVDFRFLYNVSIKTEHADNDCGSMFLCSLLSVDIHLFQ